MDVERFITENFDADPLSLRLKYRGNDEALKAIEQIELRKKSPEKFIGRNGVSRMPRKLYSRVAIEQATAAAIADFHASLIFPNSRALDMTMGMGSDAVAIASVKGVSVTAIERNQELAEMSRVNFSDIMNLCIICADSVEWLSDSHDRFDVIFIDPARRDSSGNRVVNLHDCTPDVVSVESLMLEHTSRILIKLSPMLDVSAVIRDLRHVKHIYIVEHKGECRELLVEIVGDFSGEPTVETVGGNGSISFTLSEEDAAVAKFGKPAEGDYLYEPGASAMKSGAFKLMSVRFGLTGISVNSHLYFSPDYVADFPGKIYRISSVLPYSSSVLKRLSKEIDGCSVAVRNFPISAAELRRKMKMKEGDKVRLMATTGNGGEKMLLLLEHTSH